MAHTLRLLDLADGPLIEQPIPAGQSARVQVSAGLSSLLGAVEVVADQDATDPFVAEHLDEIIGIAAAAVYWRDEMRRPKPPEERLDPREQAMSMRRFMQYGTILDTASPGVKAWLLTKVPDTMIRLEGSG